MNEMDDYLAITNPGVFIPGSIREVLRPGYNPPYYRNALLASAMANFRMIDTATSGIKKVFLIQKERFFPMPDYEMVQSYQVTVTVYGKTLNDRYTHILYNQPGLDLETVYLLDQVQKGKTISDSDLHLLQEQKLIRIEDQQIYLNDGGRETDKGTEISEGTENNIETGAEISMGTENSTNQGTEISKGTETNTDTGIEITKGTENSTNQGTESKDCGGTDDKPLTRTEAEIMRILTDQPSTTITVLSHMMGLSVKQGKR